MLQMGCKGGTFWKLKALLYVTTLPPSTRVAYLWNLPQSW